MQMGQSVTHAVIQPTHSPSWEELLLIEVTEHEANDEGLSYEFVNLIKYVFFPLHILSLHVKFTVEPCGASYPIDSSSELIIKFESACVMAMTITVYILSGFSKIETSFRLLNGETSSEDSDVKFENIELVDFKIWLWQ